MSFSGRKRTPGQNLKPNPRAERSFSPSIRSVTAKKDLNETFNQQKPKLKLALKTAIPDRDLECDLAYNDHILALMKGEIIKSTIETHMKTIKNQTAMQEMKLTEIVNTSEDVQFKIQDLEGSSQVIDILEVLNNSVKEVKRTYDAYDVENMFKLFLDYFNKECNKVNLISIKKIETQEEYDNLLIAIKECLEMTEKFLDSGRDFEKVQELADVMRRFIEIQDKVLRKEEEVANLQKELVCLVLQSGSDIFAKEDML